MKPHTYREVDAAFGQAMLTLRVATGLTQTAMAKYLGVTRLTISSWEIGKSYPKLDHLIHFIELCLDRKAFKAGSELQEIKKLWHAAHQKVQPDDNWLFQLVLKFQTDQQPRSVTPTLSSQTTRLDWGDAPSIPTFYGRETELTVLEEWVVEKGCRIIGVLGMGGIGKSALTVTLLHRLAGHFEAVMWRSLRDAPPLGNLIKDCLQSLAASELPDTLDTQIRLLLNYLRKHRLLVVLDNMETLLQSGPNQGQFRAGYEDYGRLLQLMAQGQHQSCVILTSREKPAELVPLEGANSLSQVRILRLAALEEEACRQLLGDKNIRSSREELNRLSRIFAGNPLALKIVAQTVVDLFGGEISLFLLQAQEGIIFGGVKALMAGQFARLSPLEQKVLTWLAVFREAATLDELLATLVRPVPRLELLEALTALHRRSLIERGETPGSFGLQSVVLEYLTIHLVEAVTGEVIEGQLNYLTEYALMQAQAKEYVRQSQQRVLLEPVLSRLRDFYNSSRADHKLEGHLSRLLEQLRALPPARQGYGGGNILHLLIISGADLRNRDFSKLNLWQAYLYEAQLHGVNMDGSDLKGSVFKQDFNGVADIAFSPDGKYLVSGSWSGKVLIWRLNEAGNPGAGFTLHSQWKAHPSNVTSVTYSPDGTLIASVSFDRKVRLWDAGSGQSLKVIEGHTNGINQVVFSPDGKLIASTDFDCVVRLWRVESGKAVGILKGHTDAVYSVAFSPAGALLASSSYDGIRLWKLPPEEGLYEPEQVAVLTGHQGVVNRVVFSRDGQTLFSISGDATIRVWSVSTHQELQVLEGHPGMDPVLALSPDGTMLASGGGDNLIRLWRIDRGKIQLERTLYCSSGSTAISFSPDSATLITGQFDNSLRVWSVQNGKALVNLQGWNYFMLGLCVSPNGAMLASSHSNEVLIWQLADRSKPTHQEQTPCKSLKGHSDQIFTVSFGPDSTRLASAGLDNTIKLWDLWEVEQGKLSQVQAKLTLKGHSDLVYSVAFNPSGSFLASSSSDKTVRVWSTSGGELVRILKGHEGTVRTAIFSPDGKWLASGGKDRIIRLWEVESFRLATSFGMGGTGYANLVYHSSGQFLAASRFDGVIEVWQISQVMQPEAFLKLTLKGHQGMIWSLDFNPRPDLPPSLLSAGDDGTIRLWNIEQGEEIARFQNEEPLYSVVFTPDGGNIIASDGVKLIKQWDIERGELIATYRDFKPCEGVNIKGVSNLSAPQRAGLLSLGAIESGDS
jgi:WD40 repeat protein/transcriptional regulator with XRE-family HTH domain